MPSTRTRPANNNPGGHGVGNQGNNHGGGQGSGGHHPSNHHPEPSPWLGHPLNPNPQPHETASFVEYLRWMRTPDAQHKEGTRVQLVSHAESRGNYIQRLQEMNRRTRLIAGDSNTFTLTCPWRIRVGGTKGPEEMLLPAFDALGMPYIPSSTLRGVTRAQGVREFMAQGSSRAQAEREIAKYLGDLDAEEKHKAGKIVFLDAYPVATNELKSGGLAVDIANNIWSWEGNNLRYSPNPNLFFSLKQAKFLIGIRKGIHCTDEMLATVKEWLIKGLAQGIGSQINSGYGRLVSEQTLRNSREFLRLPFELKGQLIHGRQTVTWNAAKNRFNNHSIAEVRPVAFKNMMRYWFRAFGLGVLPASEVQEWEGKLFGAITPHPQRGWIQLEILDGKIVQREPQPNHQGKNDPVGQQSGILVLSLSDECPDERKESSQRLFRNLAWLMFHLGGVGQGARRPCYSRRNRDTAPWWRGSTLIPRTNDKFRELPESAREFAELFRRRIKNFFEALATVTGQPINPQQLRICTEPTQQRWTEAVDTHCRILITKVDAERNKPYALAKLHQLGRRGEQYDRFLCGGVGKDVIPSPVWIADSGGYEVVTVFGATADPRRRFVDELRREGAIQIFPLNQGGNR
ncbi:RAMP superfamily CRISPR-associated protein [Gloeomargaritales cyanobacterium VI4D9]|nr:RAMP superfamily CRISPR-associated protein [Gloeomargaritales cyanobacterium VI4D9]